MAGTKRDTAFYVVAYDVVDDRRRNQVHKTLKGFGEWVQYSVFECFLTPKEVLQMRTRLLQHLDPAEDQVRIYNLCEGCLRKVVAIGCAEPREQQVYIA